MRQTLRQLSTGPLRLSRNGWILAAGLVLVLVILLRLMIAPVAIPAAQWVSERASAALKSPVTLDAVSVQLRGLSLRFVGRGFSVRTDAVSARADGLTFDAGLWGREVTFAGMRINARAGAGNSEIGLPRPNQALGDLGETLRQLSGQLTRTGLRRVSVKGARLQLITAGADLSAARVFRDLNAELIVDGDGFTATADAIAREGRASIALTFQADAGVVSASVNGVTPTDLGGGGPIRSGFATEASLVSRVNAEGVFQRADIQLNVGPGVVRFARDPVRRLDSAAASISISPDGVVSLTHAKFVAGGTVVEATGTLKPPTAGDEAWPFVLRAPDAVLDAEDVEGPPVIADLFAEGRVDPRDGIIHFERASADLPFGRADAVMTFIVSEDGRRLAGAAHISSAPINELMKAWPIAFVYQPRKAIRDTVMGGVLVSADLDFALTPRMLDGDPSTNLLIDGGLTVDATVRKAVLSAPGLPLAAQAMDGVITVRDRRLTAEFSGGRLPVGEGSGFAITEATLRIPETGPDAKARISASVEGDLSAVVELADELKIEAAEGFNVSPEDVTGTVNAVARMTTPLGPAVTMDQRSWSIDAQLRDASSSVPIGGQVISRANLEVLLNARRVAARGRATIDGLTIDVNYNELFAGGKSGAARFIVTDEERARRGFDTGNALRGPVTLTVEQTATQQRTVSADLTRATISLPVFRKAAGVAMEGEAVVNGDTDALDVTEIRLDGAGAFFAGNLAIRDGALRTATINQLALSEGDRLRGRVGRTGRRYDVALVADRFDARQIIEDMRSQSDGGGDNGAGPAINLDLEARRVLVANNGIIGDLDVKGQYDGERIAALTASGRFDDTAAGSFAVSVSPNNGGPRTLQADLTELGRALSALGIYDRMDGGRTTLDARLASDGVMTGRLMATDFVLSGERSLEQLIATTNRALDEDGRNPLPLSFRPGNNGDGLPFERLMIDFRKTGGRIQVNEAILRGTVVGGTASGTIDLDRQQMDIAGTLIPAYGVNNLFGRLPILGGILGGGDKGGLIGVTFKLVGNIDNPTLVVNPISAIAPGIFRRIFEFQTAN